MSLDEELRALFFEGAAESLQEFEQALLLLEKTPQEPELTGQLFRCVHTLKGNSRVLGFERVERFSHGLEDLLDIVRHGRLPVTAPVVDILLGSLDMLKALVEELAGGPAHDPQIYAHVSERVTTLIRSEPNGLAASREHVVSDSLGPAQQAWVPSPVLESQLLFCAESEDTRTHEPAVSSAEVARKETRFKALDTEAGSVRVPIDKLDQLINLTGEVVIAQSMIEELVSVMSYERADGLQEVVAELGRHCRSLQERMLATRMLPLRNVFTRFQRLVRDLRSSTGKELRLELSGEEIELDKTILEKIADPLTHLVRNAVDHGLEPTEARLAAGKPAEGYIRLSAYQKGGNIFVELSDDGRGLDRERILAKARANGLVRAGASLSDEEVYALIFHPGLSTAEKVTELSGRGVGMDVVKRNIEAIKGSISIATRPGQGTCFRLKLPLTLAVLDGLGVRVGREIYLVPLLAVVESLRPQPREVHVLPRVGAVVDVRGECLPLVRLHEVFRVVPSFEAAHDALVMVIDDGAHKYALQVDELVGQYQAVIKGLEANFCTIPGIAGATVLGDGRVGLILDTAEIALMAGRRRSRAAECALNTA